MMIIMICKIMIMMVTMVMVMIIMTTIIMIGRYNDYDGIEDDCDHNNTNDYCDDNDNHDHVDGNNCDNDFGHVGETANSGNRGKEKAPGS